MPDIQFPLPLVQTSRFVDKITTCAAAIQIDCYYTRVMTDAEHHLSAISIIKLDSEARAERRWITSESPSYAEVGDVISNLRPTQDSGVKKKLQYHIITLSYHAMSCKSDRG